MKNRTNILTGYKILSLLFAFILVITTLFPVIIVSASSSGGGHVTEIPSGGHEWTEAEINEFFGLSGIEKAGITFYSCVEHILMQAGIFVNGRDLKQAFENDDALLERINKIWNNTNVKPHRAQNGKIDSVVVSKVVTNELLTILKDIGKKPDNGGYELIKTVPVNKVSALYFHNSVDYRSMYDLVKDNGGIMGLYYSGQSAYFYKIDPRSYYVRGNGSSVNGKNYYGVRIYKNVNDGAVTYKPYYLAKTNVAVSSWDDTENLHLSSINSFNKIEFKLYDCYSAYTGYYSSNPFVSYAFVVSSTGVPIPVFNSVSDLVAYTVANNLYYTTSDYTGEGQEVIIDYDELDKILSGYYNGMYDMLQHLIEQNGGNALTPEQVQALADQVAESFDMLKTEINKGFEEQDKLIQANSNILKAIKSVMEKGFEDIKELLDGISKKLENLKIDTGGTGGGLIVGGVDILLDLAEFVKDFVVDTEKGVATLATGFTDIVGLMAKKFPFSIPWDISLFIARFAHAPEAPVFEIPVILSRYGIDEKFVIDFSDFEIISKISRSILSVLYAISLIKFTDKVIMTKKGGVV